ncbi:MAG: EamA family transporter RarD [Gammaproteobacteria bacterium]|nr:EamA family transporter RarD [Gammaproteobacteria bacterium]
MTPSAQSAQAPAGVWAALTAFLLWGFSALYYRAVGSAGAFEILAHRIVWSLLFCCALILIRGRGRELAAIYADRKLLGSLLLSALLVSVNWLGYIWAVNNGHALEASMGYYLFPLVMVFLGAVILQERISRLQRYALLLVSAGVVNLLVALGEVPWIALLLATSFGLYGLVRKQITVGPLIGLTVECLLLSPAALLYFAFAASNGALTFGSEGIAFDLLLAGTALMTAVPLLLFTYAAKRMRLATLGMLQYLNPSVQFLLAVTIIGEPFTSHHLYTFLLIWAGVFLFSYDSRRPERRQPL